MTDLKLSDATAYSLFRALEADPNTSQRALARILGILDSFSPDVSSFRQTPNGVRVRKDGVIDR